MVLLGPPSPASLASGVVQSRPRSLVVGLVSSIPPRPSSFIFTRLVWLRPVQSIREGHVLSYSNFDWRVPQYLQPKNGRLAVAPAPSTPFASVPPFGPR